MLICSLGISLALHIELAQIDEQQILLVFLEILKFYMNMLDHSAPNSKYIVELFLFFQFSKCNKVQTRTSISFLIQNAVMIKYEIVTLIISGM